MVSRASRTQARPQPPKRPSSAPQASPDAAARRAGPSRPPEWRGDSSMWPEEKKLRSCDPVLAQKVRSVLQGLRARGFQPKIVYAWRSVEVQAQLVKEGRSQVQFSFHNAQQPDGTPAALASDIVDARWNWTPAAKKNGFWKALSEEAKRQGLEWGGNWQSFPDVAHVQAKPNSELAAVKAASGY